MAAHLTRKINITGEVAVINKFTHHDKEIDLIIPDCWGRNPDFMRTEDKRECSRFQEVHLPVRLQWKDVILFSENNFVTTGLRHVIADYEKVKLSASLFKDIEGLLMQQSRPALLIMVNDGIISPARLISAVFHAIIYRPELPLLVISEEKSRAHELLKNIVAGFTLIGMREDNTILRSTLTAMLKNLAPQKISDSAFSSRAELYDSIRSLKKEKILKSIKITKSEHEASRRLLKKTGISDKYTQMVFLSVL